VQTFHDRSIAGVFKIGKNNWSHGSSGEQSFDATVDAFGPSHAWFSRRDQEHGAFLIELVPLAVDPAKAERLFNGFP
jgi:hypothetical protein